jgi:hypothetical protein
MNIATITIIIIIILLDVSLSLAPSIRLATLPLSDFPGLDEVRSPVSRWGRDPSNPILANGPTCVRQAADPKVYYDGRLDDGKGAW